MELARLDDYQAYLLTVEDAEGGVRRGLVDPWLRERFCVGAPWIFGRRHGAWVEQEALPAIDFVLLTAHFADHCDPATLDALGPSVRILGTKIAARLLRRRGRVGVEVLEADQRVSLAPGVELRAVAPGFPYAHNSLGYCVTEARSARRLYLETHVTHGPRLAELVAEDGPVDLAVLPVQSVRLLGVQFAMDPARVLASLEQLGARFVLPTGLDPGRGEGLLAKVLRCRGSLDDFARALGASELACELVELAPGQGFRLDPGAGPGTWGPRSQLSVRAT